MASNEIRVSLDQVIHRSLTAALQKIYEQHGIRVKQVNVEWIDTGGLAVTEYRVLDVELVSSMRPEELRGRGA